MTSVFDIAAVGQGILFLVSLLESLLSAFAGGGAGQARLPALSFLGLPFGLALATRKIAPVALHLGATLCHLRERPLARRLVLFILGCRSATPIAPRALLPPSIGPGSEAVLR